MIIDVEYNGGEFQANLIDFQTYDIGVDSIENEIDLDKPLIVTSNFKTLLEELMKAIRKELEYKFII